MDPLILTSSFATIMGLVCNFAGEQRAITNDEYNEFIIWLQNNHHNEIRNLIISNKLLSSGLGDLFKQSHADVLQRLNRLDEALASVAAHVDGFGSIAEAVRPGIKLSDQSVTILSQLNDSGGSKFLGLHTFDGSAYLILDGNQGALEVEDLRFIEDDLCNLTELGYLRITLNSRGEKVYNITRQAAAFVIMLNR
jgi:hypothetical protein